MQSFSSWMFQSLLRIMENKDFVGLMRGCRNWRSGARGIGNKDKVVGER
jgi:hypothetical protein